MILLVHLIFGVTVGLFFTNLYLAILTAFLSHYLLDAIPHIEYIKFDIKNSKEEIINRSLLDILLIFFDFSLGILLISIFAGINFKTLLFGFFAILPDTIFVIGLFWKNEFLAWHEKLDKKFIFYIIKKFPFFGEFFLKS